MPWTFGWQTFGHHALDISMTHHWKIQRCLTIRWSLVAKGKHSAGAAQHRTYCVFHVEWSPVAFLNKLHCLTERDNGLTHYFVLFWCLELLWGYLATSSGKSYVVFLLSNPDFLWRYFAPVSLSFFRSDMGQICDRRGNRNTRLSHCKCVSLKQI